MRRILVGSATALLVFACTALAQDHEYTSLSKCKMCHKGEKKGAIYEQWEAGPHAKAFESLAGEKAKEVYAELGKTGDPQQDPDCLRCHVTGYGEADSLTAALDPAEGVTCQACHGAGGDYYKKSIMEDRDASIANGMTADPKAGCVLCHNEESPTYKAFDAEERWAEIAHQVPKAEPTE